MVGALRELVEVRLPQLPVPRPGADSGSAPETDAAALVIAPLRRDERRGRKAKPPFPPPAQLNWDSDMRRV